jgi:aspartokinase-like uncharacterized kinase
MRRVIKVGGSLLSRPNLPDSLNGWIARQSVAQNLVIVGGGELVDAIRRLDQVRPGDPVVTHWRCVELMETSRMIFASWFDWESLSTREELCRRLKTGFSSDQPTLVAVRSFYDRNTECDAPLDWRTTSDTIAAILAVTVGAQELVLLKSCVIDPQQNIEALAANDVVDGTISRFANRIPLIRVEQLDEFFN